MLASGGVRQQPVCADYRIVDAQPAQRSALFGRLVALYRKANSLGFATMLAPDIVLAIMVAAAIAPPLLLLWFVVAADSRPEPPRLVLIVAIFGALSAIVAGFLEQWLQQYVPISHKPWLAAFEFGALAGIPEEAVKISVIAVIVLRARAFDEPMDGIVYGTAVGLGFATFENLIYIANADTKWEAVAVTRGILGVPLHAALGAIAGAYLVKARFGGAFGAHKADHSRRFRLLVLAWLIPIVMHSVIDASALGPREIPSDTALDAMEIWLTSLLAWSTFGVGAVAFAGLLATRILHRQRTWLKTKRLPPSQWRGIWAQCVIGVGMSVVALTLVITGNSNTKIAGWALMVVALGVSWNGARFLTAAAKKQHRSAAVQS